jgi:hypothetical protein
LSATEQGQQGQRASQFLRAMASGDRGDIVLALKIIGTGALVGAAAGAVMAVGESVAIGLDAARETYGMWWVLSPLFGATLPIAVYLFALLTEYGDLASKAIPARVSERVRRVVGIAFVTLLSTAAIGGLASWAFDYARRQNALLIQGDAATLSAVDVVVRDQQRVLADVSSAGGRLLGGFDQLEQALRVSKAQLAETLGDVRRQAAATDEAARRVTSLADRQRQLELRMAEFGRLSDGKVPITLEDLQAREKAGLVEGFVSGFVTSLAAAYVYQRLSTRVKRAPPHNERER